MKDYNFFNEEQSKMFSLFGRSRGNFHFNCLALINEQCKENNGYIIKDVIIAEIESTYGIEYNARLELQALVDAGWIELFQRPHLISDFIRLTKDGRILYNAIVEIHEVKKDFSYGKYISDIYRRLSTIQDGATSTYQDILLASYEDVNKLKEYMQVFKSAFEDFVKGQRANVKSAEEVIKIMQAVREGKEFRNYKAIIKDEFNYYRYSNSICNSIESIKENEEVMKKLVESCSDYELYPVREAKEHVLDILYAIKAFFVDEYKELVDGMKESENECYQKIANTLTLYASDGTANKSICELIIKIIHDAQEGEVELPDEFFRCFDIFDNNLFDRESFRDKRKAAEYKKEDNVEIKELTMVDKINILVAANEKMKMKSSTQEITEYLNTLMKDSTRISSNDFPVVNERDYANVFLILANCANPAFEYEIEAISDKSVNKGLFKIPYFELRRKEKEYENREE
ncbi:Wadjet anti-phage system protein JetA family protein [Lacrimispora amygdalina]|uniref:Wadjet anti-phage system protein JetA family protein n=1 Tax=Lacrimispora amygdalina TaxID=253257 RepID=UPI000BE400A9|nr:Wadjet anti-phage system protein JetA family protein [Lacrimispora amygdalina]